MVWISLTDLAGGHTPYDRPWVDISVYDGARCYNRTFSYIYTARNYGPTGNPCPVADGYASKSAREIWGLEIVVRRDQEHMAGDHDILTNMNAAASVDLTTPPDMALAGHR